MKIKNGDIAIETLEPRKLLSQTFATLSAHGLLVNGTAANDVMRVHYVGTNVVAMRNGAQLLFPASNVRRIMLDGGEGNNQITNDTGLVATLRGGAGNDTLIGGKGTDFLRGGFGENYLDGRGGFTTIDYSLEPPQGEAPFGPFFEFDLHPPTDHYVVSEFTGDFNDVPVGINTVRSRAGMRFLGTPLNDGFGANTDFFVKIDARLGFSIDGGGGNDTFGGIACDRVPGNGVTLIGGNGMDDFYRLNETIVKMFGGADNDTVRSVIGELNADEFDLGKGFDTVDFGDVGFIFPTPISGFFHAGPGVERVIGPPLGGDYLMIGNDLDNIFEPSGDNVAVFGNGGDDLIDFPSGNGASSLVAYGGAGNDTIQGANFVGHTTVDGGSGDDLIAGGFRSNFIIGGAGNDTIFGDRGADTIQGNSGNDLIDGGSGDDRIFGGSGNDRITGGGGRDLLDGQAGDDRLFARDTLRDTLFGGAGFDRAQRDNSSLARDLIDGIEQTIT